MVIEVNRDNFESEVLESQEIVLLDFWGPLCKPCLALMPTVDQLEQEYAGKIKIGKVNAVENRMLCAKLRVMGLPTFLVYKNKTEIQRLTGEQITRDDLIRVIDQALE